MKRTDIIKIKDCAERKKSSSKVSSDIRPEEPTKKSKKNKLMTSIDPVTLKTYKNKTKRIQFNRKLERSQLPLLIVKFEGIVGSFIKDDLESGKIIFYTR